MEKTRGDSTIPAFSVLLGAIKWGYQYLHQNEEKKYKPMKLLEYCADSKYNLEKIN